MMMILLRKKKIAMMIKEIKAQFYIKIGII